MISPKPHTPAWRALALIVRDPGEITSVDIAKHLWQPPPRVELPNARHTYVQWCRDRQRHACVTEERASRIVRRLGEAGLIETRGRPVLADWFLQLVDIYGWEMAMRKHRPGVPSMDGSVLAHLAMARQVAEGPTSVADVLGANPSGWRKRVWNDVCRWGCVIPPSRRFATERGVDLIAGRKRENAA